MRFNEYSSSNLQIKIFHSTVNVGTRPFTAHHHTAFEISACVRGGGIYNVSGREYAFSAGDLFVFGTDESHCITKAVGPVFELVNIQFDPPFLWLNPGLMQLFFNRSESFSNMFEKKHPSTRKIFSNIHKIENEFINRKPENELMISLTLTEILITMIRDFGYVDYNSDFSDNTKIPRELKLVTDYINNNSEKNLTLDFLAKKATMSRTYFCTVFKKFNGISPWDYITIKRVEKAVELIKYSDKTTIEIAAACGFNSLSNFYKSFKKITGKRPGDYFKTFDGDNII